jgi:hypothetical protein
MKSFNYLLGIMVIAVAYYFISEVRLTITNSDIYRNIYEFNDLSFSDYNAREPLYWFAGKLSTAMTGDPWRALTYMDIAAFICLFLSLRHRSIAPIAAVGIVLSPLFILGICNIHRQMIGFAAWVLVARSAEGRATGSHPLAHLIPFLIHNSLGILSVAYLTARYISERNWRTIIAIVVVFLIAGLLGRESIGSYFREGTETNTSLAAYLLWFAAVGAIAIAFFPTSVFFRWYLILGGSLGTVLFVISGGSSGSRFFMMVLTSLALWLFDSEKFRGQGFKSVGYQAVLAAALILPTISSSFSSDILKAAIYRIPYGVEV